VSAWLLICAVAVAKSYMSTSSNQSSPLAMPSVALFTLSRAVKAFRVRYTDPWTPHGIDPVIRANPKRPTVLGGRPERLFGGQPGRLFGGQLGPSGR
jgi:hypothetical protein